MTTVRRPLPRRPGIARRLQTALYRHRAAQLLILLAPPVGWFGVIYLGSLAILFVAAFWYLDPLTSAIRHDFTLANFQLLLGSPVYRTVALRTIGVAAIVTLLDIALAFPIAFFMARVATGPAPRGALRARAAPAVDQLPGPRLRLARDPGQGRSARLVLSG